MQFLAASLLFSHTASIPVNIIVLLLDGAI